MQFRWACAIQDSRALARPQGRRQLNLRRGPGGQRLLAAERCCLRVAADVYGIALWIDVKNEESLDGMPVVAPYPARCPALVPSEHQNHP